VLTDYQGNWYKVITETGSLVEQYSFDAWGKRRNATNWSYGGVPVTFTFYRGYTGHEMLDAFGLINMNGRVYDPVIARFLSPDNYVQSPTSSQGFNRYSYCLNNPLVYSDPSGDIFQIPFMVIAAYIAMQGVIAGDMASNTPGMGFAGGFALGATTAGLSMGIGSAIGPVMAGTGFIPGAVNMMVPAAISGGITYGLNSAITGQTFDWKGYGLSVGMAGVMGGMEGGSAAYEYNHLVGPRQGGAPDGYNVFTGNAIYLSNTESSIASNSLFLSDPSIQYTQSKDNLIDLNSYVNDYFPNSYSNKVSVTWKYWNQGYGETTTGNLLDKKAPLVVKIPKKMGYGDPCGLLFDCVGHEIWHINDFASGRAAIWFNLYGAAFQNSIMENRAYSANFDYSSTFRGGFNNGQYNPLTFYYAVQVAKYPLPAGYINK